MGIERCFHRVRLVASDGMTLTRVKGGLPVPGLLWMEIGEFPRQRHQAGTVRVRVSKSCSKCLVFCSSRLLVSLSR